MATKGRELNRKRILCVGASPALQRVMIFQALTIDAVNRAKATYDGIAGKSVNVAKVLKSLGENPVAVGFAGGEHGTSLVNQLKARKIATNFVSVQALTRQCVTVIDETKEMVTELVEETQPVSPADYETLLAIVRKKAAQSQAIILSGTLTPGGPVDFYRRCARLANVAGAFSVVDAQGPALRQALETKPGVIKPNRSELAATVGHPLPHDSGIRAAMRKLNERGAQRVVVTAGKAPTLAYDGRFIWRINNPVIRAVNPIGSGDAFTAGLVWRLLKGDDLGEACRWAAAVGAANALTILAGEIDLGEVEKLAKKVVVERVD